MENFDKDYEDGNNIEKLVLNLILKNIQKPISKKVILKGGTYTSPK